ncbi:MAG: hypothetical protein GX629_03565 [Phycisphaerae bacterium]|jgi:hypothetical protein|nr:hypothetical protein [Phycisphaerae bacterium]
MGTLKICKYLKTVSWLVLAVSILLNTGCSIFVTRETKVTPGDSDGTRATENVEVGTDIEAPAGDWD